MVWSSELAYAIGLITTDGCLSSDGRHLILVSKDIEQLKNLKKCLGLKVIIGSHSSGRKSEATPYYRVQWGDVVLYNFLLSLGLTAKKSLTLGALSIPDGYFFDFLRGSFDGDGSFYSYYDPRWKSSFMYYLNFTSASAVHIQWLRESLKKFLGVEGHISRSKETETRHELLTLRYAKRESLKVLNAMYAQSGAICLSRKRLKITRVLRIVGESLPDVGRKLTK